MTEPADVDVRRVALDPERSFIVQAPAGSGKTELLIQRHLRLLERVQYPEQVVAVTFTRKAAAEMRARVLQMLELARSEARDVPAHQALSVALASKVLARDRDLGWGLLERPGRLRIETVDALNAWLADRLPIAAGGLTGAAIVENADALYRRAAEETLLRALTGGPLREHAAILLGAADNSLERLIGAVAAVLPTRDQWLGLVADRDDTTLAAALEAGLRALATQRIDALGDVAGASLTREAFAVAALAAASRGEAGDPDLPVFDCEGGLGACLAGWQAVSRLLLTGAGDWRRRFTVRDGFPPNDKAAKTRVGDLVKTLGERPHALALLRQIRDLPGLEPDAQLVARVTAARALLLHTVAELKVVFERIQAVDFLELALGAQTALGAIDEPSELLLALDRRIEHLLVDEFQDTSHSQFRLLELITSGWVKGDGRTLFLVGDPMQSIYRFRDADMSLFLRAKSAGLGNVELEHLVLTSNFRSGPAVVGWVNRTFSELFPDVDEPATGRAAYYPFEARQPSQGDDRVTLHRMRTADLIEQQARVARLAADALESAPDQSVAVLVQSRSHLRGLRAALDSRGIPVRAVELDLLADNEAIQDLIGLTRALLHPGDRIAWLAVLRAPWCGLSWSELHAICREGRDRSIRELVETGVAAARMDTDDARERLEFVRDRLARGFELRGRYPLSQWVECVWHLLDGPATLQRSEDLEMVMQFFGILGTLAEDGDVPDPAELARAFEVPFRAVGGDADAVPPALEIMTIHRAKGLEFDTVILFGLDRRTREAETKLLYWQQLARTDGEPACLLATLSADGDPLTSMLQRADRELDRAERARLLYVAVTRARRRLHLVGHLADRADEPATGDGGATLMAWLAPQFAAAETDDDAERPPGRGEDGWLIPMLRALDPTMEAPPGPLAAARDPVPAEREDYEWASLSAAHIGTVVHRALQTVGDAHESGPARASSGRFRAELRLLGVADAELDDAATRTAEVLERVFADETGRWILKPRPEAQSELELAIVSEGELSHLRIDRTFIDEDGVRWIIDYKTSRHAGGDPGRFIETEVERYRPQLEAYARAMSSLDSRPIRVGLYFPMLGEFRDWVPAIGSTA